MFSRSGELTSELQLSVEQFYFEEARYLDSRQYQQWLTLLSPDIVYTMPARTNPLVNPREKDQEHMISVERELEQSDSTEGCPLREENIIHLTMRADRAYKRNSWAENPPARTRRIIGNIEILEQQGEHLSTLNNFLMFYSRHDRENSVFSGQRRDKLLRIDSGYKIGSREVILDFNTITLPTVAMLL